MKVGTYVKGDLGDWMCVTYLYGDEKMVAATGLGKKGTFPIVVDEISDTKEFTNLLEFLMDGRNILWMDKEGRFYFTRTLSTGLGYSVGHPIT
jgi:hypothetical protein